jgi:hypothetical protein
MIARVGSFGTMPAPVFHARDCSLGRALATTSVVVPTQACPRLREGAGTATEHIERPLEISTLKHAGADSASRRPRPGILWGGSFDGMIMSRHRVELELRDRTVPNPSQHTLSALSLALNPGKFLLQPFKTKPTRGACRAERNQLWQHTLPYFVSQPRRTQKPNLAQIALASMAEITSSAKLIPAGLAIEASRADHIPGTRHRRKPRSAEIRRRRTFSP